MKHYNNLVDRLLKENPMPVGSPKTAPTKPATPTTPDTKPAKPGHPLEPRPGTNPRPKAKTVKEETNPSLNLFLSKRLRNRKAQ